MPSQPFHGMEDGEDTLVDKRWRVNISNSQKAVLGTSNSEEQRLWALEGNET